MLAKSAKNVVSFCVYAFLGLVILFVGWQMAGAKASKAWYQAKFSALLKDYDALQLAHQNLGEQYNEAGSTPTGARNRAEQEEA